jgi:pimeloyl-ACP methyl ester carboxylesterase
MSFASSIFTTPDGAEIAYRIRPGRDPLVLLHGLGCDASMWDGVIEALSPEIGLVIPELRGHGGSTLGWRPPSVELWADDVMRLLNAKGIEKPAIAGLSMGGYVAFAIEAANRGRARVFAFLDTTAAPDDEGGRLRRATGIATIRRRGWRAYADALLPSLLNDSRPRFASHRDHLLGMFERAGDSGLPPTLSALATRPDRRPLLMSIAVPCMAIVGAVDTLTPPDAARAIAAGIPAARLHVIEDTAHMSALEAPRKVAGLLAIL